MGIGAIYTPSLSSAPVGFLPFAPGPTKAAIAAVANVTGLSAAQAQQVYGGGIVIVTGTLTKAQLDTLNAAPVTIAAAPGAGLIAVPVGLQVVTDVGSGITWSNAPGYQVVYETQTLNLLNGVVPSNLSGAGPYITVGFGGAATPVSYLTSSFDPRNKALQLRFASDAVIASGTGPTTAQYKLTFYVM